MSRIVDVEPLDCLAWKDGEHGTTFDDGVLWVLGKIGELPAAQPETHDKRTETHACDCVERQAAIDATLKMFNAWYGGSLKRDGEIRARFSALPSAQPQITHCAECIHWKHSDVRKSYCEVFDWMSKAEDFCSFAERRTDVSK